jgi:hypothetical protein
MKYLTLIIGLLFINNYTLFACDCNEPKNTVKEFESAFKSSDYILEIKIKDSSLNDDEILFGPVTMEAEILKLHKGIVTSKTIKIFTYYDGGGSCSYPFERGKTYLFYGKRNEKKLFEASICNRTGKLKNKKFDLYLLNKK